MPAPPSRSQQDTMAKTRAATGASYSGVSAAKGVSPGRGGTTGVAPGKGGGYNNNGPQNQANPGGSGPQNNNRPVGVKPGSGGGGGGSGGGISTPTASGSPRNNPVGINASNSAQELRNKALQRSVTRALVQSPSAARLAEQYSQYRSPNDYPYAGAEDLTRDEFNRVQGPDIRAQNFGFAAPISRPRSITGQQASGSYLANRALGSDVEDLRRPDLADPTMENGDWNFDPITGVRSPVYNPIAEGAIPTPRPNPLRKSPMMRTPQGLVPMWNPQPNAAGEMFDESKLTPEAQAMVKNMKLAAFNKGTLVEPFSGLAGRKKTQNHPSGNAVDVRIINPATGKALPNFQNKETFGDYQKYANAVRSSQVANNPELSDNLRWGGYFSDKGRPFGGNAVDMMHFDVNPKMRGAMALGAWDTGAGKKLAAAYGLGNPQVMAAADIPAPKPTLLRAVKKGVGALKSFLAPKPAMVPNIVAPATSVPIPRQRPMVPNVVAPATGVPIPRQKPQQTLTASNEPTISPAGGYVSPFKYNGSPYRPRGVMKNGELLRDGVSVTPAQISPQAPASGLDWGGMLKQGGDILSSGVDRVNTALQPIAEGVDKYGVAATQNYVNAKIAAMRKRQNRSSVYAQYGNQRTRNRKRQPIMLGNEISTIA